MKNALSCQESDESKLVEYTVSIVLSYLSRNNLLVDEVVTLIYNVYNAVSNVDSKQVVGGLGMVRNVPPAVPIEESVCPSYIVCLEDGRKMKMLKKHLKAAYNMSPTEYRQKWGLPNDYPMVAPEYANRRSNLAKKLGFGKGRKKKQES